MDDSACRAGKLAGLFLLAAGMSGCVAGSYEGKLSAGSVRRAGLVSQCSAFESDTSNPQNEVLNSWTQQADSTGTFAVESAIMESPEISHAGGVPRESEIPELPAAFDALAPADEAPGTAFVCSDIDESATAQVDEAPGRAFISNYDESVVVYQEVAVPVPVDRWPGYRPAAGGQGRRQNVAKRQTSGYNSATRGIVRYVDQIQGFAQVVFGGMTVVEPGTRIAVQHQLLFGKLASTEFLEVVSSEPGAAIVRPIGNGRICKAASGDAAIVMSQ